MKLILGLSALLMISCSGDVPAAFDGDMDASTDTDTDTDTDTTPPECYSPEDCEDAFDCTIHDCDDGTCLTWVSLGWCLVDGACVAEGDHDPLEECQVCDNSEDYYDWTDADGITCADQYQCTHSDICVLGTCQGTFYACDDSLDCTDDECEGDGGCDFIPADGMCVVDGGCHNGGDSPAGNPCQICSPSDSQTAWSDNDGVSCDDGSSCSENDICAGGVCSGDPTEDSYEPNDNSAAAFNLGSTSTNNSYPQGSVAATLHGPGDVDVFVFDDDEDILYGMRPRVDLTSIPAGYDYELCAYFQCDSSDSNYDVDCAAGAESTWGSLEGCCSTNGAGVDEQVILQVDCASGISSEDGTTYVFVTNYTSTTWTCEQYSLSWGDD